MRGCLFARRASSAIARMIAGGIIKAKGLPSSVQEAVTRQFVERIPRRTKRPARAASVVPADSTARLPHRAYAHAVARLSVGYPTLDRVFICGWRAVFASARPFASSDSGFNFGCNLDRSPDAPLLRRPRSPGLRF